MTQPRPPAHLSKDAKSAWRVLLVGGESPMELMALEALAVQVARAREAGRLINSEGLLAAAVGPKDRSETVPHPALAVERAAHDQIRRWVEGRQVRRGSVAKKEPTGEPDADGDGSSWAAGLSAQVRHPS